MEPHISFRLILRITTLFSKELFNLDKYKGIRMIIVLSLNILIKLLHSKVKGGKGGEGEIFASIKDEFLLYQNFL